MSERLTNDFDMHDNGIQHRLRRGLDDAAGSVDTSRVADGLDDIRHTAKRRTRRRNALVGVTGSVVVIALVGTFAAIVGSGDDSIQTVTSTPPTTVADDTVETVPDPTMPADPETPPVPDATIPPAPAGTPGPATGITEGATSGAPITVLDDPYGAFQWLEPWGDGFLAIGLGSEPAGPPAELPEELAALFPQEIIDVFPDGLPATMSEATDMLREAGVYDEAMEIINSNQELSSALSSTWSSRTTLRAELSDDGLTWGPTDIGLPAELNDVQVAGSTGDRLVIAGTPATGLDGADHRDVIVASTTDLVNWTTQVVDTRLPSDLPAGVSTWAWLNRLAVTDTGWALTIDVDGQVDPHMLNLDPAVLDADTESYWETDINPDGTGVILTNFDGWGTEGTGESIELTWDQIGIGTDIAAQIGLASGPAQRLIAAGTWDGTPTVSSGSPTDNMIGTSVGFLRFGSTSGHSPDGTTWTELAGWPTWAVPVVVSDTAEHGVVVVASLNGGAAAAFALGDPASGWMPIELAGMPSHFGDVWSTPDGTGAVVADLRARDSWAITNTVEHDGYRLSETHDGNTMSYELVDLATGEVVASEQVDLRTAGWGMSGPYENFDQNAGRVQVTVPETGVVVTVPSEIWDEGWGRAYEGNPMPDHDPVLRLITADGAKVVSVDVPDTFWDVYGPMLITQNGDTIVVAGPERATVYHIDR